MLKKLYIENYALIDQLEIEFGSGFSVITGETGAGKSILLGALSLILGQRADTSVLLNKDSKCIVEGNFQLVNYDLEWFFDLHELDFDNVTIIRREINQTGKSRAFINDTPVNLPVLKELGDHLVNIHSQNSITTLNERDFQLALLDDYAGIQEDVKEYRTKYTHFLTLKGEVEELQRQESKSKEDSEYYQFLFNELEASQLVEGEKEQQEQRLTLLSHAEEIKTNLNRSIFLLSEGEENLIHKLSTTIQSLSSITRFDPTLEEKVERLKSNQIDLVDIASDLERIAENVNYEPDEMEKIAHRLDVLYKLEKKHRVSSIEELLRLKREFSDKLLTINTIEEQILAKQHELTTLTSELLKRAEAISISRSSSIPRFEEEISSILQNLGMPNGRIKISKQTLSDLNSDGIDDLRYLFSSNKGVGMDEVSKIASGGELSRLMLSMKSLISQKNLLPTVIFDEIDMGVSGEVAAKVGTILKKMSTTMQVIAITHLPQIAGMGEVHYWVYKENEGEVTHSRMKRLSFEERIHEIAKMLSSGTVSKPAMEAARELLSNH